MGKAVRRTLAGAGAVALTLGMAGLASAAPGDPFKDDPDRMAIQHDSDFGNKHLFRVAGNDRVTTAIKLMNASTKNWTAPWYCDGKYWASKPGNPAFGAAEANRGKGDWQKRGPRTLIVASSADYADALVAAPLADMCDAPVLLSAPGNSIDQRVIDVINGTSKVGENYQQNYGKKFTNVIFMGGTGVFSEQARAQLTGMGVNVERQRGVNRYETATGVANRVGWMMAAENWFRGGNFVNPHTVNVFLATGQDFPDALSAGAGAADNDGVVLLTQNTQVESFTQGFLNNQHKTQLGFENGIEIHTVGGWAERAFKNSGNEGLSEDQINTGSDRYKTAVMVASKFKHKINKVVVASGEGFADGVAGGAWVANHDGPLVLTQNGKLTKSTGDWLKKTFVDYTNDIIVVGGTGSVSLEVSKNLSDLMKL